MHLPAEEFFNSRAEIYHARRAIRVSKCAQSRLYRNSERTQSRRKDVKCFARKTPQKQGFKTCKIEKINRLAGCKTGDWQGGKNVFLSKNITLAALYASFWRPICMPLTHKGIQIDMLKQCFSSKIYIKRIYKHAENPQITEYKIVTNMSHICRICDAHPRCLQISQGAKALLSRKFSITFRLSYPRGQSLLPSHEQARSGREITLKKYI